MGVQTSYKTVGEIKGTNTMRFKAGTNGLSIALALLSSHTLGAPVVDDQGKFVGFISEFDLLRAVEAGKDLRAIRAQDIMNKGLQAVTESTPIADAIKLMEEKHLLNLPVVKNGVVTETITRHDLLRASLGVDLGIETH